MNKIQYIIAAIKSKLQFWLSPVLLLAMGCGGFPADPENSLNRGKNHTLNVGIMINPPFTVKDGGGYKGIEVVLVKTFAEKINAEIKWTEQTEEQLFKKLENFELDMIVGGITNKTPRKKQASLTTPYKEMNNEKFVMAVAPGENRFLLELEKFIHQYNPEK